MDLDILLALNRLAGQDSVLDALVVQVSTSPVFKGLPLMMLVWGLWMLPQAQLARRRAGLAATLAVAVLALVAGRLMSLGLPYRARPIHDPELPLRMADTIGPETLGGWSSMPSDHAVLFFALATGIALVDRRWGAVALAHALFVIAAPRVILGFHWPSDILVGGLIGAALALVAVPLLRRVLLGTGLLDWLEARPGFSYPLMFLVTHQLGTMFTSTRNLLAVLRDVALG
ncbi:phosphatase PAP2 family protein [Limimaricola sp.]|uniref:phosphatase PAP2 family protein n=1 Tax=Limimaricola sp. TaxID=2211665 RepID=UPI0040594A7C